MRELSSRKSKAGEGLVERKKRRERSYCLQLEHGIKRRNTCEDESSSYKLHISLCGFYLFSSFQFHTDKDEGIYGHQTLHLLEQPPG